MKKIWSKYFYWNKTERVGVIPLFIFMFILIGANIYLRYNTEEYIPTVDEEFLARAKEFNELTNQQEDADSFQYNAPKNYTENKYSSEPKKSKFIKPSAPFNPNELSQQQWMNLGLSEKQAGSISRFQQKGGKFYRKEDLKKMYVITEDFYNQIEPYLIFPATSSHTYNSNYYTNNSNSNRPISTESKIDINKADSTQLTSLKGITPKMAQKILSIRKTFGGFHSLEQLKDLYGFYEPNYDKIAASTFVGPVTIKTINLNYCTFKELLQVPGLNYDLVKAIMNHRERNGSFKKTEDLVTLNLAEPDLYAKIAPYLTVK